MSFRLHRRRVLRLLAAASTGVACARAGDASDLEVAWTLEPPAPAAGHAARVTIAVRTAGGSPVTGARLRVEGHMAHPGMAPLIVDLTERAPGTYGGDLTPSMAGAWTLVVDGVLPDGQRLTRTAALTASAGGTSP